jgi:PAS domain S-box-containing protein
MAQTSRSQPASRSATSPPVHSGDDHRDLPWLLAQVRVGPEPSKPRIELPGYSSGRFLGMQPVSVAAEPSALWDLIHVDDRQPLLHSLESLAPRDSIDLECRVVLSANQSSAPGTHWIRILAAPTEWRSDGTPIAYVATVEDITARKRFDQSLSSNERHFRQLAENINEVFWVSEPDPRKILYVSPAYETIWGRTAESLYEDANSFIDAIHPEDRQRIVESLPKARLGGYDETYRVMHDDGSIRTVRARAFPVHNDEGQAYRIAGIVEDITKSKQAAEELETERRFLEHLLQVQEGERKLVAYDIHDGFVQLVIAAVMHLDALAVDSDVLDRTREKLKVPVKLLRDSIEEARRIISGLRPPIIDEQGLVAAIDYLIHERPKRDTRVTFEHPEKFQRLDAVLEGALFRIVQEALNNVYRHSQAASARVQLVQNDYRLSLVVEDSGIGFDPQQVSRRQFGLRGIRERARLFGGTAQIRSSPGCGTRVVVELPLNSMLGDAPQPAK